ncbi:sensor histidine kinase [Metabacillus arenae]|uniref:histidine kinase n=1 Tax=Metabacillus arenae TaxID=2771434 RepID=A0A926NK31_9BACI|nr:sensor histidine kinase [Metabacillus arenae]MBD1383214.1 sensor histidine kinase [Metabacillus arenae]
MKLFIRDQLALFFFYMVQLFFTLLVFWLDGYTQIATLLYVCLLNLTFLIGYLSFRYIRNRSLYNSLSISLSTLDDMRFENQSAPLPKSFERLQKEQIQYYSQEIDNYKQKLDNHVQLINQSVHQLKTPLAVMQLMVQNRNDSFSASLNEELDRLKNGLELVLYSTRLDTFERDFSVEALNLNTFVRNTTSTNKRLFIRSKIYPQIEIDQSLTIVSDEKWLTFVLMQLITNAVRYTDKEGERILFQGQVVEGQTILEICDRGVGIPQSDLPRVFDPYFTGENGRIFQESTGMGLYLVKQVLDHLNHRIEIESVLHEGTTIRIFF